MCHQSSRTLPRDWIASEIAVREDCICLNIFLSAEGGASLRFPDNIPRCTLQLNMVSSLCRQIVLQSLQDPICLGQTTTSACKNSCLVFHPYSSDVDSVSRPTQPGLAISLVVCSLHSCPKLHQAHEDITVHCHPHVQICIVEQCCAVLACSQAAHSTDQVHIIKLPEASCVPCMLLTNLPTSSFP